MKGSRIRTETKHENAMAVVSVLNNNPNRYIVMPNGKAAITPTSLRVHMATLRKKVALDPNAQYIQTHIGIG